MITEAQVKDELLEILMMIGKEVPVFADASAEQNGEGLRQEAIRVTAPDTDEVAPEYLVDTKPIFFAGVLYSAKLLMAASVDLHDSGMTEESAIVADSVHMMLAVLDHAVAG
jgi:hypothetical protein